MDQAGRTPLHMSEHILRTGEKAEPLISLLESGANPLLKSKKGLILTKKSLEKALVCAQVRTVGILNFW